jgi:hypothetical protein
MHSTIGADGVSKVDRARDPRLNRDSTVKILRQKCNQGFDRAAQPIVALSYTSTCHVHDGGPNYGGTIGKMLANANITVVRRGLGTTVPDLAIEPIEETWLNRRLSGQASSL